MHEVSSIPKYSSPAFQIAVFQKQWERRGTWNKFTLCTWKCPFSLNGTCSYIIAHNTIFCLGKQISSVQVACFCGRLGDLSQLRSAITSKNTLISRVFHWLIILCMHAFFQGCICVLTMSLENYSVGATKSSSSSRDTGHNISHRMGHGYHSRGQTCYYGTALSISSGIWEQVGAISPCATVWSVLFSKGFSLWVLELLNCFKSHSQTYACLFWSWIFPNQLFRSQGIVLYAAFF